MLKEEIEYIILYTFFVYKNLSLNDILGFMYFCCPRQSMLDVHRLTRIKFNSFIYKNYIKSIYLNVIQITPKGIEYLNKLKIKNMEIIKLEIENYFNYNNELSNKFLLLDNYLVSKKISRNLLHINFIDNSIHIFTYYPEELKNINYEINLGINIFIFDIQD